jgi:putative transposase
MDKFQNKYRIPSARAQWWDYANAGACFITICTQNRECYFGEIVETRLIASLQTQQIRQTPAQKTGGFAGTKNPMLNNNISRVIRWYKGICTFNMRKIHADFQWQSRFHDHIIRDDEEYQRIADYINTNPQNWERDKFFKPEK